MDNNESALPQSHTTDVVLIGCGKSKQEGSHPACELYTGALFRKQWQYAKQVLNPQEIYILSAKHKLLDPQQEIANYDETLNNMSVKQRQEWANIVLTQMKSKGIDLTKSHVTILAGENYWKYLLGSGKIEHFSLPLKGMPIGVALHFLKQNTK